MYNVIVRDTLTDPGKFRRPRKHHAAFKDIVNRESGSVIFDPCVTQMGRLIRSDTLGNMFYPPWC